MESLFQFLWVFSKSGFLKIVIFRRNNISNANLKDHLKVCTSLYHWTEYQKCYELPKLASEVFDRKNKWGIRNGNPLSQTCCKIRKKIPKFVTILLNVLKVSTAGNFILFFCCSEGHGCRCFTDAKCKNVIKGPQLYYHYKKLNPLYKMVFLHFKFPINMK